MCRSFWCSELWGEKIPAQLAQAGLTSASRCAPGTTGGGEEAAGVGTWGSALTEGDSWELSAEGTTVPANPQKASAAPRPLPPPEALRTEPLQWPHRLHCGVTPARWQTGSEKPSFPHGDTG